MKIRSNYNLIRSTLTGMLVLLFQRLLTQSYEINVHLLTSLFTHYLMGGRYTPGRIPLSGLRAWTDPWEISETHTGAGAPLPISADSQESMGLVQPAPYFPGTCCCCSFFFYILTIAFILPSFIITFWKQEQRRSQARIFFFSRRFTSWYHLARTGKG